MNSKNVEKDERAIYIENISYKYGYNFITFALLFDVMYRSMRFHEATWDLLGLIIISGFIMTVYQYKQKILGKTWLKFTIITMAAAFILALIMSFSLIK
ncbi:MAG: hypothetical protein ACM3X7_00315 [Solirubrobacterales bacterium]